MLPTFEDCQLAAITRDAVATCEQSERKSGYADGSLRSWRALLHLILPDAVEDGMLAANPAAKRKGRGKRVGRSQHRAAEKTITTALGVLLIAERAALLSGRDDEFVAVLTLGFTGIRWGELVGLEAKYVRPSGIRVEWQLYELDNGQLHRSPPKDESRRTVAAPRWLLGLLADQAAASRRSRACATVCGTCSAGTVRSTGLPGRPVLAWSTSHAAPGSASVPCRPSSMIGRSCRSRRGPGCSRRSTS